MFDIVVVGSGVVGLTAAVRLQQAGARVAVVADRTPAQTVSAVAAAVWYPSHTEGEARVLDWARRTYRELARQAADAVPGVVMRPTRMLLRAPAGTAPWWAEAVDDFKLLAGADVSAPYAEEWRFTVPAVEMGPYLAWLVEEVTRAGGVIERRDLQQLSEVTRMAPVVVNATGLAARTLCGDDAVHPARGHVVLVTNPGLHTSVRDEGNPAGLTYVHPRSRDVVLGGTFEPDAWDLTPSADTGRAIVARCVALVPELAGARILDQRVGLRPARHGGARLEQELLPQGGRLIHNYGHGGAGMTLSWGCADEVTALVTAGGGERPVK